MKPIFPQKSHAIIDSEEAVDLNKASLSNELSASGFDGDTQNFHVSCDRVLFKNPSSIIQTVLEAHGYALNLENIIACLDDLRLVVIAQGSGQSGKQPLQARKYLPALQFKLPSKLTVGPLLKQFYNEIGSYEAALKNLSPEPKGPNRADQKDKFKEKSEQLERENAELKDELKSLKFELQQATQSVVQAHKAMSSQNILPPQVRLATVKDLDMSERIVLLKSGRTSLHLPFVLVSHLPRSGDRCLVHIEEGTVKGAYFFETQGDQLHPVLATVLHVKEDKCKVRDAFRRTLSLQALNEAELKLFSEVRRHDHLLLYYLGEQLIRMTALKQPDCRHFADTLQEQLVEWQIMFDPDSNGKFKRRA